MEQPRFSKDLFSLATSIIYDKEVLDYFEEDAQDPAKNTSKFNSLRGFGLKFDQSYKNLNNIADDLIPNLGPPDQRRRAGYGKIHETGVFTRKDSNNRSIENV